MTTMTTRDIGLAIRDFLEGEHVFHYDDDRETELAESVQLVDVSDPNNPEVLLDNGQQFIIRIFAKGRAT